MTIRETAMNLLAKHNTKLECYRCDKKNYALKDMQEVYPDGVDGFTAEEIALELQKIGDEQPFNRPPTYFEAEPTDLTDDVDVGHCCVSDMHEDAKEALTSLLESGEPFSTFWLSSARGCDTARISADRFHVYVETAYTVDGIENYEYILDCCENDDEDLLDEGDLDDLADVLINAGYHETYKSPFKTLPRDCSLDDVLNAIEKGVGEAEDRQRWFFENEAKPIVRGYIEWIKDKDK